MLKRGLYEQVISKSLDRELESSGDISGQLSLAASSLFIGSVHEPSMMSEHPANLYCVSSLKLRLTIPLK